MNDADLTFKPLKPLMELEWDQQTKRKKSEQPFIMKSWKWMGEIPK